MSVAEIEEAAAKLLPDDFERLVDDLRDLQIARATLTEIEAGREETMTLDELESRLGL